MRRSHLFSVVSAILLLPALGYAEGDVDPSNAPAVQPIAQPADVAADVGSEGGDDLAWDQFDDPNFDPNIEAQVEGALADSASLTAAVPQSEAPTMSAAESVEATPVVKTSRGVVLGPEGVDDQGRKGRLHTVSRGDTLWDLSAAYLGTPWVWPSVWIDNDDIANPHLIMPGDRIWITANEMRVVTDAEAESFLTPVAVVPDTTSVDDQEVADATMDAEPVPVAALDGATDEFSTLDEFPVAVPAESSAEMLIGQQITVSRRAAMGFVSAEELRGASSIVDSPIERTYLAEGDPVVLGMGEGDVEVGDQFTVFQVVEDVRDIETNRLLGHHIDTLGWIEVKQLTGDTSVAEIRMSYSEIERGVHVMRRTPTPRHVTMRSTPDAVEGKIVFLPSERSLMADGGYVYLNRGEFHGVEVGSEFEVYEAGVIRNDSSRRVDVRTPDVLIARLVVVTIQPESSVAFVLSASRELTVGDDVRPAIARLAQR